MHLWLKLVPREQACPRIFCWERMDTKFSFPKGGFYEAVGLAPWEPVLLPQGELDQGQHQRAHGGKVERNEAKRVGACVLWLLGQTANVTSIPQAKQVESHFLFETTELMFLLTTMKRFLTGNIPVIWLMILKTNMDRTVNYTFVFDERLIKLFRVEKNLFLTIIEILK